MRACASVIRGARVVSAHGNKSASSDVKVALHLAMAALHGARHNVEINLGSLTDRAAVAAITRELESLTSNLGED
jgi:formiminotetrahydrofolate cyclodeaminase